MTLQISVIDLKGGRYGIGDAIEGARDWWVSLAPFSAATVLGGMIVQHLLATAAASREARRQRRAEIRNRFEECVVRLLEETDPDVHPVPSVPEITRNIIQLQLYLDLNDRDHKKLNGHCLTALKVNLRSI